VMREHEHRVMKGWVVAPPAHPRFLRVPRARMAAEHVAAHDRRADVLQGLLDHLRALVDLAALHAVHRAPGLEREHPFVQLHAADAERVLHALLGPGDEAVERHRDPELELAHEPNLSADRARAFAASCSRFRGGALVSRVLSSLRAPAVISSTAALNAASL